MDFLKDILGNELYEQVFAKIAVYNQSNADKQVKLANLGDGGYVSKDKYGALEATHNSKIQELERANSLIAELQKGTKGNEELQGKIQAYDGQIQELQAELEKAKIDSAIKVALLEAKAQDIDYLTFKLNENKSEFTLDDNGKIKGLDEKIEGLKIKFPTQFEDGANKKIIENKLNDNDSNNGGLTKADILKKPYADRVKLFNENPDAYKEIMNK